MGEHPAIENLANSQRQLDADGCEVAVSRQAVEETLEITRELLAALHRVWDDIDDETMPATVEIIRAAIAKAEGRATQENNHAD
jgi:ABC-type nitrate/sulfonate/bicarbonate transport system substrate-binding protein